MIPHNRIVTVPVKLFAGIHESCNTALRAFARRLRAATSGDPSNGSSAPPVRDSDSGDQSPNQPAPTEETGRDAAIPRDRGWICKRCEEVHASDPTSCPNCGFTVFEPGPPLGAGEEDTGHPETSASSDVVATVAEREGVQPAELDSPLYEAIDPDALDALVPGLAENGRVKFGYLGYEVLVTGDGDVVVRDGT